MGGILEDPAVIGKIPGHVESAALPAGVTAVGVGSASWGVGVSVTVSYGPTRVKLTTPG